MKSTKYRWILYSIALTIVITVAVQIYWNYTNYKINKQRVTNDIQISLDNALEEYYADIVKTDFLTILKTDGFITKNKTVWNQTQKDSFEISSITIENDEHTNVDSILMNVKKELNKSLLSSRKNPVDTIIGFTQLSSTGKGFHLDKINGGSEVQVLKGKKAFDSIKSLKQKLGTILISMERDSLEYEKVDSLLRIQFNQKQITPSYALNHFKNDSLYHTSVAELKTKDLLSVTSKSTYIKPNQKITLQFEDPYKDALKLSFTGILLSFLLSAAIISCLFYLLKIINQQKQLAEVKNDLISNITHEFKTPISTISVALESIKDFNVIDNREKTMTYLDMSSNQLLKLNVMVEKLLETATLDSENLELNKDGINISDLIHQLVEKHNMQKEGKLIQFISTPESILAGVDPFHFENAINNVLDNAVKYGGEEITIALMQQQSNFQIIISDSGTSLKNINKDKIFEKFYRVPKGNTHDVKGFGIGLYYTKKIIEKHGGTIKLQLNTKRTTFKITLPNE